MSMKTIRVFNRYDKPVIHKITNATTLKALAKRGFITWPVDKGFKYVDGNNSTFEFKGRKFELQYQDGCFYPFVFEIIEGFISVENL